MEATSKFDTLMASLPNESTKARGDAFELIVKWFLENDPLYSPFVERVWLWEDWEGRWASDEGIDLVARDREGSYWAIQAKAYAAEARLTYRELATFFSATKNSFTIGREKHRFAASMLVASTDQLSAKAEAYVQRNDISLVLRDDLRQSALAWPTTYKPSLFRKTAPRPAKRRPRPHQKQAVKAITRALATGGRAQALMACGTGKTLVGLWSAEALKADRVLILLPSLALVRQTMKQWTENRTTDFLAMAVCSDESVTRGADQLELGRAELGVPTTTDPTRIAEFLRGPGRRVVFSTYQSAHAISKAQLAHRAPSIDVLIGDEAHRMTGPVSSAFAMCLDEQYLRAIRRLHMTATPRVFTARAKTEAAGLGVDVASMDDTERFGDIAFQMTFGDAIRNDPPLLTDYQVVVVGVTDDECRDLIERGALLKDPKRDAASLAAQVAIVKTMRKYDIRRVLTFHGRVKKASDFARDLPETNTWMRKSGIRDGLVTTAVSGAMTTGERERRLAPLRDSQEARPVVVSNARCLAEGVDVPALDCVAFVDPRGSEIDIIQAVGRAIRLAPDKKIGTIIVPVVVNESDDADDVLSGSAFGAVWQVLRALRAHDDALGEELDALRVNLGRGRKPRRPSKIKVDLPAHLPAAFVSALDVRLVAATTSSWEEFYGRLLEYVAEHGHANVPAAYRIGDVRLGQWASAQRTRGRRGVLTVSQSRLLEELPGWQWDPKAALWDVHYELVRQFTAHHGHARVPNDLIVDGYRIGKWVDSQRMHKKKGDLLRERVRLLEALAGWEWEPIDDRWDEAFKKLQTFVLDHGHAIVPRGLRIDGFDLGGWVTVQRQAYRRGRLRPGRAARLEGLAGWAWEPHAVAWETNYAALGEFATTHGHVSVPNDMLVAGKPLQRWVIKQRSAYMAGKLSSDRARRLSEIPGWNWDGARQSQWDQGFTELTKYVAAHGTASVPFDHVQSGFRLGGWVVSQRAAKRRDLPHLDFERQRKLEALPGWSWKPIRDGWRAKYEQLQRYVADHGTALVPQSTVVDGFGLGSWVTVQRVRYRQGALTSEEARLLEALTGWQWDPATAAWEDGFAALEAFVREHGHARVPQSWVESDFRLGTWVNKQRGRYRSGRMPETQARRLEALPAWLWEPQNETWEKGYRALLAFVDQNGHARIPRSAEFGGFSLGAWVAGQRGRYARGVLPDARIAQLEAVPHWKWRAR